MWAGEWNDFISFSESLFFQLEQEVAAFISSH